MHFLSPLEKKQRYMQLCLQQARIAFDNGEVPIGAIIVLNDKIIAKAYNQVETLKDPTAHAEILAITSACNTLGTKFLTEAEIFISVEPCTMCFGAIQMARLKKIIYGASEPKYGFSNFITSQKKSIDIEKNILAIECLQLMQDFFKNKR